MDAQRGSVAAKTSLPTRAVRVLRVTWHLLRGLYLLRTRYRKQARAGQLAMIRLWSQQLLHILGISLRALPDAAEAAFTSPCLMVANHVTWLDPFVIHAVRPARFVAKVEIRGWPLIGPLTTMTGAIYIERVKRRDAHRIGEMIAAALDEGDAVAVFPEGTTTTGETLLPFHAGLLQAAVDRALPVQPLALRYLNADGSLCVAAANVGAQTLLESFLEILALPAIDAELQVLPPLAAVNHTRRELAREAESAIARALAVPVVHRQAGTPGGLPVAPR